MGSTTIDIQIAIHLPIIKSISRWDFPISMNHTIFGLFLWFSYGFPMVWVIPLLNV